MNKKTNLFVCILIALSINLQCNVSVYAAEDDITTEETLDTATQETSNINNEEQIQQETSDDSIVEGTELSGMAFDPTTPEFVSN